MNHSEIVSFIWGVADLIRDTFKRGKYQDVILPLTVLRRLDCVLGPTKEKVLKRQAELRGKGLQDLDAQLRKASGFAFYNTSRYDFYKLLADAPHVAPNLRNYIAGFSPNMREVLEKFDFDNTISKLTEAGLLFQVLERFKNVDLHPDKIDNPTMGMIFEELIRKFNEALNENPGEHFTPRDVVHLMVDLMLAGDTDRIRRKGIVSTVYDPCCGSGGMLMITKEHIAVGLRKNGDLVRNVGGVEVGPLHQGADGLVTNRKASARKGLVQLIDASSFWTQMRKSLGDKRREIPVERAQDILKILADFLDGDVRLVTKDGQQEKVVVSKIFPTTHFGYRKITVERPLRLNFQASADRIARLEDEKGFHMLAESKKKGVSGEKEKAEGRAQQEAIRKLLRSLPNTPFKDREDFERTLDVACGRIRITLRVGSESHPGGAVGTRRDGGDLPRQGRPSGGRSRVARQRKRAAFGKRRDVLCA
jgi:type I restriction-modification system DNA methylase subunit